MSEACSAARGVPDRACRARPPAHSLSGGVGELVLAPAVVALLDAGVVPQGLDGVHVPVLERRHLLHVHVPDQERVGLGGRERRPRAHQGTGRSAPGRPERKLGPQFHVSAQEKEARVTGRARPWGEAPKQSRDPGSRAGPARPPCRAASGPGRRVPSLAVCTGCGLSLPWAPTTQLRTGLRLGLSWDGPGSEAQRARTRGWRGPPILCGLGVNEGTCPPATRHRSADLCKP